MRLSLHGLRHRLPPGPGRFPYLDPRGALALRRDPLGRLLELYREFGPAFTVRIPGLQLVMLIGPEANQRMLVTHHRDFTWRDSFFGEFIPFLGDGLLTTDDEEHDRARRLLAPAFRGNRIRTYAEHIATLADAAAARVVNAGPFELHDWSRKLALRVASEVLFGIGTSDTHASRLAHHFEGGLSFYGRSYFTTLVLRGPGTPFRSMLGHVQGIDEILLPEIERRRRAGAWGDNVLDTLIGAADGGDRLSEKEIRDQMLTLLFAGHDTTAATVSWMFALLGRHPAVESRLREEIQRVVGRVAPTAEMLINGLPYLDRVLKETLRLYPAAWFGPRRARVQFELYGHTIPAGTHVAYSSWVTHRLPHLWPDPDAFDPDRFEPERAAAISAGAYIPFGRGPRICIGMRFGELEVKAIAVALLRRLHLELQPGQTFAARTVPTISPRHGVHVVPRPLN